MALLQTETLALRVAQRELCKSLSVEFRAGENWAILGANGSGKTTLLHTLAGLRAPDRGQVTLDGHRIDATPHRARAKRLGILFQDFAESFPGTVLETVLSGRHPHLDRWQWESTDDRHLAQTALCAVDLDGFAARPLTSLSGGERRRVEIATVLTQDVPILLWDEPTNHLDLRHQKKILELLSARTRRPEHVNIFVLHDVNLARRFCSHAILLYENGECLHGAVADTVKRDTLERLYRCQLREIRDGGGTWYLPV